MDPERAVLIHHQYELRGWFLDWMGKASEPERAVVLMMLYHMCRARNEARDGKVIENPSVIVDRVWRLLEEW